MFHRHGLEIGIVGREQPLCHGVGHDVAVADGLQHFIELTYAKFLEDAPQAPEIQLLEAGAGIGKRTVQEPPAQHDRLSPFLVL